MFSCDLHLHSTASDGLLAPEALMALCAERGLVVVALTDHDTLAGQAAAAPAAVARGLKYLYGVELSCQLKLLSQPPVKVHILGYWSQEPQGELPQRLAALLAMRHERAREIGRRLEALGLSIDMEALLLAHKDGHIGRPHIAQSLMAAGYVTSKQEAFDRYLHDGGPAYVPYGQPLQAMEAVSLITASGGRAVLAHPGEYGLGVVDEQLPALTAAGLVGIECSHPRNSNATEHHYRELCLEYGLAATGGSDFHGPVGHGGLVPGKYGCLESAIAGWF